MVSLRRRITWIGLLYFFNLVNVPFQKALDPETKKKVNPDLLSRALWFFRWGAVITVLAGLAYFAMYTLKGDVNNANAIGGGNINLWWVLFAWLTYPIVLFIVEFLIIKKAPALIKDGRLFAIVMFIIVAIVPGSAEVFRQYSHSRRRELGQQQDLFNRIGGAYGIVMMLNVWGIIWPNNKRIIARRRALAQQRLQS